jgi:hypothetical protein
LSKIPHFVGDNGESHACLPCPGCFHSGVQRQNVCLERNVINNLDNSGNAVA